MRRVILSALLLAGLSATTVSSAAPVRSSPTSPIAPRICLDSTLSCPPSPVAPVQ